MKNSIITLFLFLVTMTTAISQTLFKNINQELCVFLSEKNDPIGPYMVYMVVEDLTANDSIIINKWSTLTPAQRSIVTHRWAIDGKRIESVRVPYTMYKVDELKTLRPAVSRNPFPYTNNKPAVDPWGGAQFGEMIR